MKLKCIVSDNCDLLYLLRKYCLIKFLKPQYLGTNSFQLYLRYRLRRTGGFSFSVISLAYPNVIDFVFVFSLSLAASSIAYTTVPTFNLTCKARGVVLY